MIASFLFLVLSIFGHLSEAALLGLPGGRRETQSRQPYPGFNELDRNVEVVRPSDERQLMGNRAVFASEYGGRGMEISERKDRKWVTLEPRQVKALAWREDLRCGEGYTAPNGEVAQCNPFGMYPCCSTHKWCGNTAAHCTCGGCIDYSD